MQGFIVKTFWSAENLHVTIRISANDTPWFRIKPKTIFRWDNYPCDSATWCRYCFEGIFCLVFAVGLYSAVSKSSDLSESPKRGSQGKLKQLLVEAISSASECSVPRFFWLSFLHRSIMNCRQFFCFLLMLPRCFFSHSWTAFKKWQSWKTYMNMNQRM